MLHHPFNRERTLKQKLRNIPTRVLIWTIGFVEECRARIGGIGEAHKDLNASFGQAVEEAEAGNRMAREEMDEGSGRVQAFHILLEANRQGVGRFVEEADDLWDEAANSNPHLKGRQG